MSDWQPVIRLLVAAPLIIGAILEARIAIVWWGTDGRELAALFLGAILLGMAALVFRLFSAHS